MSYKRYIERAPATFGAKNVYSLINPATEEPFATLPISDQAQIDRAVTAARAALPLWRRYSYEERAVILDDVAVALRRRGREIADLVTLENGSPEWWSAYANVDHPARAYQKYARIGKDIPADSIIHTNTGSTFTQYEPVGVVGVIVPWNAPQAILAGKVGPALAAGCTLVIKPAPQTALDAILLREILTQAGLPKGVVSFVYGGKDTGERLVRHAGIDMIAFTGSTATGSKIGAQCATDLKPFTGELGGKSAAIILDDAATEDVVAAVLRDFLPYTGQVCYACTRLIIQERKFDEVLDAVHETLTRAPLGDPQDPAVEFGPLVSSAQLSRAQSYLSSGIQEGAVALGTGHKLPSRGYFMEPSILINIHRKMSVFQEEIFGPILTALPFDDDETAATIANDSKYGLSGMVFTSDSARGTELARNVHSGRIRINGVSGSEGVEPFGYKHSGVGRRPIPNRIRMYEQFKIISTL